MTVLPNSFERYTAALRILTSLLILKCGLKHKYLKNLSKIYTAESFFRSNFYEPLDIKKFSLSLLYAIEIIKFKQNQNFTFEVKADKNFLISKDVFTVLILNLCKHCEEVYIRTEKKQIIINFKGNHQKSLLALKKLKGFYFYSIKTGIGKIVIPVIETNRESVYFASEWENIFDRFSSVNLFFENIL